MPYSDKKNQKEYHKNWYKRNKDRILAKSKINNKIYINRNIEYVKEYKLKLGCARCGYNNHHSALDFHHLGDKEHNICKLVRTPISIKTINEEIAKCIVLCANCHRIEHYS